MAEDKHDAEHALSNTSLSDTAEVIGSTGPVDEKKLLRKLDLRLLPGVSVLYLLSFLDRSNGKMLLLLLVFPSVSFFNGKEARTDRLQSQTHASKASPPTCT